MAEYICSNCGKKIVAVDEIPEDGEQPVYEQCMEPDWDHECCNCGATPIVPATGMCDPCTWGEADTVGGNW